MRYRAGLSRLTGGEPARALVQRLQLPAVHADGHEFPLELTLAATDGPGGPIFHAFCHDVTASWRISRFADVEATVLRRLTAAPSSNASAARVVETLAVKMGWPVAGLWLADDDRQVLLCAAQHAEPGRRPDPVGRERDASEGVDGARWAFMS